MMAVVGGVDKVAASGPGGRRGERGKILLRGNEQERKSVVKRKELRIRYFFFSAHANAPAAACTKSHSNAIRVMYRRT